MKRTTKMRVYFETAKEKRKIFCFSAFLLLIQWNEFISLVIHNLFVYNCGISVFLFPSLLSVKLHLLLVVKEFLYAFLFAL